MTLTQYNTTVGHTGIARLCLAQKCYRTRTKLAEDGKPQPLQVGGGCHQKQAMHMMEKQKHQ